MEDFKYEKNYIISVAGKEWKVDKIKLIKDFEGDFSISRKEFREIHKSIAVDIISNENSLTYDEFEFLCSITSVSFVECAKIIRVNKSSISQWKNKKKSIGFSDSVLLKNFFLSKIFPEEERRALYGEQIQKTKDFARKKHLIKRKVNLTEAA